ncbi:ankyrin repeat domain-containing protein [bacterium]|nr:ankyrin repeat domain-containing protein [bacterium]
MPTKTYARTIVLLLFTLASGCDRTDVGEAPRHLSLHALCISGEADPAGIRSFIEIGADPNAAHATELPEFKVIGEQGPRAQEIFPDYQIVTALHLLAINGSAETIESLIQAGAAINAATDHGFTPLHFAAIHNPDPRVITALLDSGARMSATTDSGIDCRQVVAIANPAPESTMRALTEHRRFEITESQPPLLHLAIRFNRPAAIPFFIELSEDLDQKDLGSKSAVHHAALRKSPEILKMLIAAGADVNIADGDGWTPLHHSATGSGNPDSLVTLINAGVAVDSKTTDGRTALHIAASHENDTAIDLLLEARADPNTKDRLGKSPLHLAAASVTSTKGIHRLIEAGADVNATDLSGGSPLDFAPAAIAQQAIRAQGGRSGYEERQARASAEARIREAREAKASADEASRRIAADRKKRQEEAKIRQERIAAEEALAAKQARLKEQRRLDAEATASSISNLAMVKNYINSEDFKLAEEYTERILRLEPRLVSEDLLWDLATAGMPCKSCRRSVLKAIVERFPNENRTRFAKMELELPDD